MAWESSGTCFRYLDPWAIWEIKRKFTVPGLELTQLLPLQSFGECFVLVETRVPCIEEDQQYASLLWNKSSSPQKTAEYTCAKTIRLHAIAYMYNVMTHVKVRILKLRLLLKDCIIAKQRGQWGGEKCRTRGETLYLQNCTMENNNDDSNNNNLSLPLSPL